MQNGTVVDRLTGAIVGSFGATSIELLQLQVDAETQFLVLGEHNPRDWRWNKETEAMEKLGVMPLSYDPDPSPLTPGEVFTVTGIPIGGTVMTPDNEWHVVNDGEIQWTALEPGSYDLFFEHAAYKRAHINVTFSV